MLVEALLERGWIDGGGLCDPEDINTLPRCLAGKDAQRPLPRRAVWIAGDSGEVKLMHAAFSSSDARLASRFRVSGLPGTGPACFKTYTAAAMADEPFSPTTFVLPAQRAALLAAASSLGGAKGVKAARAAGAYWVGKPKCNYSGRGITVADDVAALADGVGVVQRYVHRPLLIGESKFHMRVYMLVTALDPVRAYIHNDLCVMFSTMPYTLSPKTLGKHFEPRVHLTNYGINAKTSNAERYLADKPGVGRGCLWDGKRLERWLLAQRADITMEGVLRQLRIIGRAAAQAIADHPNVRRHLLKHPHAETVGYELFGLDTMLDADGKAWLLECNDSPGLEYCAKPGMECPDAAEGDATTRGVIHDMFALLGFDRDVCDKGRQANFLRVA
jgi:hypothetical protein